MLGQRVPIGPDGREDIDDGCAFGTDRDLVVDAGRDPPRPTRSQVADLVADREREPPCDTDPELLVLVLVPWNDRVGSQLDERKSDPFALHASSADRLAPQVEDGQRCEVDEVAHEAPSVGWGSLGLSR